MHALSTTLVLAALLLGAPLPAAEPPAKEAVAELIEQAQAWLLTQQQEDGSFLPFDQFKLGTTLLVIDALAVGELGLKADHPGIAKALAFVEPHVHASGGVFIPEEGLSNYTTSIALMVWSHLGNGDPARIKRAQNFILGLQNTDEDSPLYGGIRYAGEGPKSEDLSNTGYALEALHESGMPADDPRMQAILKFVERCQNLSEVNDQPWAGKREEDRGGAVYAPDESKAGGSFTSEAQQQEAADQAKREGALRSYGSMTYQLIKSYLYLDLKPDDLRVQAARDWVLKNYQFDANPGMPGGQEREGRLFYLLNMSKTFALLGATTLELPDGRSVDWRADLFHAIRDFAQKAELADGAVGAYWMNDAQRWGEGLRQLATAYMVVALKRIHESLE